MLPIICYTIGELDHPTSIGEIKILSTSVWRIYCDYDLCVCNLHEGESSISACV